MDALGELYGEPESRPHGDAVAELVLTVLSQNTSDRNSGRAFVQLMRRYEGWDAVAEAPLDELIATIQTGGLAQQKAPRIKRILEAVRERAPDWNLAFLEEEPLEEARTWLRGLPGVGPKTAACVLLFALGRPALPVDTHVERVAKRLALVPPKTTAGAGARAARGAGAARAVLPLPHAAHQARAADVRRTGAKLRGVPAGSVVSGQRAAGRASEALTAPGPDCVRPPGVCSRTLRPGGAPCTSPCFAGSTSAGRTSCR